MLRTTLALVVGLFAATKQSSAALILDAGPASTVQTFLTGNYVAGSEFTTTTSLTIRSLGYLDAEGNGLAAPHQVGLWSASTQTLITSVTVTPTSPTVLSAQGSGLWFMEDISPITLAPGTYRIAGSVGTDGTTLSNDKIGNGVTITSGYVRTDFPNGGFAFPNLTFGSQAIRVTLSTNAFNATTPIPEPATLAVLGGLALVGLAGYRRRKAVIA